MRLRNDFNNTLMHPSEYLPRHAIAALEKNILTHANDSNPYGFIHHLIEMCRDALEKNYGIPYDFTSKDNITTLSGKMRASVHDTTDVVGISDFAYWLIEQNKRYSPHTSRLSFPYDIYEWLASLYVVAAIVSEIKESEEPGHEGMMTRLYDQNANNPNGTRRRVRAKFSRVWNYVFPGLPHALVDALSDKWNISYGKDDSGKYHFHVLDKPEDFEMVYELAEAESLNIDNTTPFSKHLSNSCMQYYREDDDGWHDTAIESGIHCVKAYGLPEKFKDRFDKQFKILFITDNEDPYCRKAALYGRVIFCESKNGDIEWGPIYVVSEAVRRVMIKKIVEFKDDKSYKEKTKSFIEKVDIPYKEYPSIWKDAPMVPYINPRWNNYIATHLTIEEYKKLSEDKDYISIIFPYLDVGSKQAYLYPDHESGKVFARVVAGFDNEKFITVNGTNYYYDEEDRIGYGLFYATEHRGVNTATTCVKQSSCKHCGKYFWLDNSLNLFQKANSICSDCMESEYFYCELSRKHFEKSKHEMVCFYFSDNSTSIEIINDAGRAFRFYSDYGVSLEKVKHIYSCVGKEWTLSQYRAEKQAFSEYLIKCKLTHVPDFCRGPNDIIENVIISEEMVFEYDGRYYIYGDKRFMFDDKFEIHFDDAQHSYIQCAYAKTEFNNAPKFNFTIKAFEKLTSSEHYTGVMLEKDIVECFLNKVVEAIEV